MKYTFNIKKKSKKSEVTQAFTFLSAAIIIGVIFIFGSISVYKLINNTEKIHQTQFRKEIEDKIDMISSKYGSVKIFDLNGLNKFSYICVYDLDYKHSILNGNECMVDDYPLIQGELEDSTANIFLLDDEGIEDRFLTDDILLDSPYCSCKEINSMGSVKIKLEGIGRVAKFSFVDTVQE